jgi:hypothetical protein
MVEVDMHFVGMHIYMHKARVQYISLKIKIEAHFWIYIIKNDIGYASKWNQELPP